jgi:hypothetical protein
MSTTRRRRGRRIRSFLTGAIRKYLLGLLFVALGVVIMSALSYLISLVPETTLTIGNTTSGGVTITNTMILNFIAFALGIVFVITGIRKFLPRF